MMIRLAIVLASAALNASILPAAASQCASPPTIATIRTHWAAVRSQFSNATDRETACRVYAASFYESVTTRQAAVECTGGQDVSALDIEDKTFNDLLASKCGG